MATIPYDLADTVPLTIETRDATGNLANATLVTLTVTLPDLTTAVPAVTNPSAGIYQADYTPTMAGRHTARWVATGVNASGYSDIFDVREATPPYLVSLYDMKQHLNLTTAVDDEELRGFIEAATRVVENVVGPVVVRTVSEVHGPGNLLTLNHPPVLALASIAPVWTGGITYAVGDVDLDATTGIVRRLDGTPFVGPLRVTYSAGRRIVPATMTMAAKVIVGHMWETQRGHIQARRPSSRTDDLTPIPGISFMVPRRVLELLDPDRRMPMMA